MSDTSIVHIVIKNPTQSNDFRLDMPIASTVLDLKQKLTQSYENHPPASTQKLIFAGRLLQDDSVLADILRQHDTSIPQTFHLVVRPAQAPQPNPSQQQPVQPPNNGFNNPQPQNLPPQQGFPPNMQFYQYGGLYQPYGYMQYGNAQFGGYPGVAGGVGVGVGVNAGAGIGAGAPPFRPYGYNPYFPYPPGVPGMPQPGHPQQPPPNAQQLQPPRPVPPAAGEGANNMSLLVKLAFLVFILAQGGGQERLILLAIGAVLVFLYQTGRIRVRRVHLVPPPQPHNVINNNNANNNANNNNNAAQPAAAAVAPQQPPHLGLLGELGLVVTSFIYSLFPTWQPQPQPQAQPQPPQPQAQAHLPNENNF